MTNLLRNELLKLKRSKSVKILFWYFALYAAFSALFPGEGDSIMQYAFSAPFTAFGSSGASGLFFFAAIAAGVIAEEFSQGTIHNALGCGVERRSYFVAKVCNVMCITAFIYLFSLLIHCVVKNIFFPFAPDGPRYSHYWLKVLVYNLGAVFVLLCSMSVYILFSYLFRKSVITFVVSALVTFLDLIWYAKAAQKGFGGPVSAMWKMTEMIRTGPSSDRLLSTEFLVMLLPSLCIGIISLITAYRLFQRADIN